MRQDLGSGGPERVGRWPDSVQTMTTHRQRQAADPATGDLQVFKAALLSRPGASGPNSHSRTAGEGRPQRAGVARGAGLEQPVVSQQLAVLRSSQHRVGPQGRRERPLCRSRSAHRDAAGHRASDLQQPPGRNAVTCSVNSNARVDSDSRPSIGGRRGPPTQNGGGVALACTAPAGRSRRGAEPVRCRGAIPPAAHQRD